VATLALHYAARQVPRQVLWEAWPGEPWLLERLPGPSAASIQQFEPRSEAMNEAGPDDAHRTRFRRPLGLAIMAYKSILGLSEILVGVLLAVPSFDPQATFARLSAEELREDPGDRIVALVSRHLPSLLHHRGLVAVGLVVFGLAKLVAAVAMWEGQEWGGYLLAGTVALLLPFDIRLAVASPTVAHVLLAVANAAALLVLVLLLRGWLPVQPLRSPASRT
jgi:uncharacterized membrane protein